MCDTKKVGSPQSDATRSNCQLRSIVIPGRLNPRRAVLTTRSSAGPEKKVVASTSSAAGRGHLEDCLFGETISSTVSVV